MSAGSRRSGGMKVLPKWAAFTLMTWRYWGPVPTADSDAGDQHPVVISVTKANGQVQDTLTYIAAAMNRPDLRR